MEYIGVKGMGLEYSRWSTGVVACKCKHCGHSSRLMCVNQACSCCDLEDQFSLMTNVDFESIVEVRRPETVKAE